MSNLDKLKEVQCLNTKIQRQKDLISYYDSMSLTLGGGGDFSSERVDCTRNNDAPFVKWIYKRIEAEEKLKEFEKDYKRVVDEAYQILEFVENVDYRRILTFRYICFDEWDVISEKVHLSRSTTLRYHKKGIAELNKIDVSSKNKS